MLIAAQPPACDRGSLKQWAYHLQSLLMPLRILPPALKPSTTIGIVAPASNISREALAEGCSRLQQLGYKVAYSEAIFAQELYFAGMHQVRADDLNRMFRRDDIGAVLCARGGYGTVHLLPLLDFEAIRANPKPFIGYSDITTLLTAIHERTGLVTFHGPMATKDFTAADGVDLASWNSALSGASEWELDGGNAEVLVAGDAEGVLFGGCLSLLAASLGTPYEIDTRDKLLFLEDINAKPFQIDRMLMQLYLAGKFATVRGVIFGEMLDCVQSPEQPYTLQQVIHRTIGQLGFPIVYGVRSGHVSRQNITLPIGVRASLHTGATARIKILEPATR